MGSASCWPATSWPTSRPATAASCSSSPSPSACCTATSGWSSWPSTRTSRTAGETTTGCPTRESTWPNKPKGCAPVRQSTQLCNFNHLLLRCIYWHDDQDVDCQLFLFINNVNGGVHHGCILHHYFVWSKINLIKIATELFLAIFDNCHYSTIRMYHISKG